MRSNWLAGFPALVFIARAVAHPGVRAVVFALVLSQTIMLAIFILAPIFQAA